MSSKNLRSVERIVLVALFVVGTLTTAIPAGSAPALARPSGATPDLIERAVAGGEISRARGLLYLAYALADPERLPSAYRGTQPWRATLAVLELQRALPKLRNATIKAKIESVLDVAQSGPGEPGLGTCFISTAPMPDTYESEHFYIEYNALTLGGGLTIEDYAASLEGAWTTEVDSFGWAAPPVYTPNPPPGGKYHVRIDDLTPLIYGFVSNGGTHAGEVGDNPNTPWDEGDADASCMVLNRDFSLFPGTPQQAMDATTAHEFNHSIQFGYGGLSGANTPDDVFVEGGATWMEDEVYDAANDNYNYLWPTFEDDMGEYEDSPYPYWITFRGLTERYGTGIAGGGEDVMQDFWEITSRNEGSNLQAMQMALAEQGTNLQDAYHAYSIAVKFNRRCGGGYFYPYCFEEGPEYVVAAGATEPHGDIASPGGSFSSSIVDNYALNWVTLPPSGTYSVALTNDSSGGQLRGTIACDTGHGISLFPLAVPAGPGATTSYTGFDPSGCSAVVLAITNQAQTAPDPASSEAREYSVTTAAVAAPARCPNQQRTAGRHIVGTAGDDVLIGTDGNDVICGLGGSDRLYGRGGKDVLDTKDGVRGNDFADGGPDKDKCIFDRGDTAINC